MEHLCGLRKSRSERQKVANNIGHRCQCTQQKLQSIYAVLTYDPQPKKNLNIFCKRQMSIKLFYKYQKLQCRDKYFFKIKFVFFLYLRLSASKENDLPFYVYISDITQTVRYRTPVFTRPFPWRLHITITYNIPHLRLWYADVVTVIAYTPEVVCQGVQTSRHEKDGTWSELT